MDEGMQTGTVPWPWIRRLWLLKRHPEEVRQAWLQTPKARGLAAAQEGRLPAAIRLLEQARRENTWADPDLDAHISELRAIRRYRRRLQNRPNDPEAMVELGKALMAQELADEALACFRKATVLAPTYAEAYTMVGLELQYRGDLSGAEEAYRQSLRCDPSQLAVRKYLHGIQQGHDDQFAGDVDVALAAGA